MEQLDENLQIARRSEVRDTIINGDQNNTDVLISVCPNGFDEQDSIEYHHFNMKDGKYGYRGEHSYPLFQNAVATLYNALRNEQSIVIHCESAQSRSVAVSAASLTLYNNWTAENAVQNIYEIYPRGNIEPSLLPFIERSVREMEA